MNRPIFTLAAFCCFVMAPRVDAQPPATKPAVAADPNDVKSVDAIIDALYDANTALVDTKRNPDRLRSLFAENARLIAVVHDAGGARMLTRTTDEYVTAASSGPPRHGFSEREIARRTEAFGSIVQIFSTYETHRDSTDAHPVHGINSIQLMNDGRRWWVVSVLWDVERPGTSIPAGYLKSPGKPE